MLGRRPHNRLKNKWQRFEIDLFSKAHAGQSFTCSKQAVLHSITDLKSSSCPWKDSTTGWTYVEGGCWTSVRVKVWGAEQNNCSELTTFVWSGWSAELHHCYVILRFALLNTDCITQIQVDAHQCLPMLDSDVLTCCYYSYYCSYNRLSII